MLPTLAVGWQTSGLRGREAGCFRKVAGMSIVAVGGPRLWETVDVDNLRSIENCLVVVWMLAFSCAAIPPWRP